jgi:tRNA modification GTPase
VHERHAEALQSAHQYLQHASMLLEQRNSDDCLAADLKEALRSLEAIVGRVDYEQVLDKVFSKFCIGK